MSDPPNVREKFANIRERFEQCENDKDARTLTCLSLRGRAGVPQCCALCHEDRGRITVFPLLDGRDCLVCCKVFLWIVENIDEIEQQ